MNVGSLTLEFVMLTIIMLFHLVKCKKRNNLSMRNGEFLYNLGVRNAFLTMTWTSENLKDW